MARAAIGVFLSFAPSARLSHETRSGRSMVPPFGYPSCPKRRCSGHFI